MKWHSMIHVIELIEWMINNSYVMRVLCFITGVFMRIIMRSRINGSKMLKDMNIAFICDGNRRYARKLGFKDVFTRDGGLRKIYELVEFGYHHGIREMSFFCFGLKNFGRSSEEVNGLMNLIRDGGCDPERWNIKPKFKVYGRLDCLDDDVKTRLVDIEMRTQDNDDIAVNIFFAYSAEDEIKNGIIFNNRVDLLIRTGGVRRLSDFMLRQVSRGTDVFFADVLWPELTTTHLFLILLKHQLENKYL